jgi:DNA replication protein DnaC
VLVEEECKARDESNRVARLKQANFPVEKTLSFDLSVSSLSRATYDYLAPLEWLRQRRNVGLVGPPGTGKSHLAVALGRAAVEDHRVWSHRLRMAPFARVMTRTESDLGCCTTGTYHSAT